MKKLRVSPALLALCAAVLLFVGAFFLGRILCYRDTYGRFSAGEQRLDVEGSGPTLLEQLRGLVTVDQTEG